MPLGMKDTSVGLRADLKSRHVVPDFRGNYPIGHRGHSNYGPNGAFEEEHAEMPWVGIASTVPDMFRLPRCSGSTAHWMARASSRPAMLAYGQAATGRREAQRAALAARAASAAGSRRRPTSAWVLAARHRPVQPHVRQLVSPGTFGNYGAGSTLSGSIRSVT